MRSLRTTLLVLAQCSLLLTGCDNRDAAVDTVKPSPQSTLSLQAPPGVSVSYDKRRGKAIFTGKCLACHGKEQSGAPQLGSAADWEPRLHQPLETLIQHAIHGHGRMPPKGGFRSISDTDVAAAVAYVVSRSERIVAALNRKQAVACQSGTPCTPLKSDEMLTLHMLSMMGNPAAR